MNPFVDDTDFTLYVGDALETLRDMPDESVHCCIPCTVLDPFMGSGTTAVVARRLGRRSIGIELSAEYAKLAATRLQQLSLLAAS